MPQQKYITKNGVLIKNPDYVPEGAPKTAVIAQAVSSSDAPLAVVSSMSDIMQASEIQQMNCGIPVPLASGTDTAISMMQDDFILEKFRSPVVVDGGEILDKISEIFAVYEVPLGMLNKLLRLSVDEINLDFLVDDSSSMGTNTDVNAIDATEPVKTMIREKLRREPAPNEKMTRIQEAEDRLHIMVGILAYIPVPLMQIRFLNSPRVISLSRNGAETPEQFKMRAHTEIRDAFKSLTLVPYTPLFGPLKAGFELPGKWCHYVFNDGEPNRGGNVAEVVRLISQRGNPKDHALTLISCTNNDTETEWMKEVDSAPYVAEIDDFRSEAMEVSRKQGAGFALTRGLWILAHILAATNPHDLDAMDENTPFTRFILENILGRQLNPEEYQYYFERNPNAELYVQEYPRFLNDKESSGLEIVPQSVRNQREANAGYRHGERPSGRPRANITHLLQPHTDAAKAMFAAPLALPIGMMIQQVAGMSMVPPPTYNQSMSDTTAYAGSVAPGYQFMPPPPSYNDSMLSSASAPQPK